MRSRHARQGAIATSLATMIGHFPWFFVHNSLDGMLARGATLGASLLRNAFIGFVASVVSDSCSNFMRVLKTMKQVGSSAGQTSFPDWGKT
jgi:hypothetical protein